MESDRIMLEGMSFVGYHGTLPEERALGQRFVVDVAMECDLRAAGNSDDLTQTVDYGAVYDQVRQIVEGPPVGLTETVAERIAAAILSQHERITAVRVKVAKPQVRLGTSVLKGSAVEIIRRRAP